jgi:hypothetical protein
MALTTEQVLGWTIRGLERSEFQISRLQFSLTPDSWVGWVRTASFLMVLMPPEAPDTWWSCLFRDLEEQG